MTAAERTALTDVLQTASAGPSPPPLRRLRAAAEYVIRETEGEQIILFGSAGRGEFGKHSDFDFFVLKRGHGPGRKARGFSRLTHPDTGDRIDVLFEEPDRIPTARWNAGTVEARVFACGRTIHTAAGRRTIPTLRDQGISPRDLMTSVKKGMFRPDKAFDLIRSAEGLLEDADHAVRPSRQDWDNGCQHVQSGTEKALKSVLVARGVEFEYRHEIDRLAAAVTAIGETVPLPEDPDSGLLREISDYGKGGRYDRDQRTADPEGLFKAFRPIAGGIAGYARSRVNELLGERDRDRKNRDR